MNAWLSMLGNSQLEEANTTQISHERVAGRRQATRYTIRYTQCYTFTQKNDGYRIISWLTK